MKQEEKIFLKNLYRESKLQFEKDYFKSLLNLSAGALALSITVSQIAFSSDLLHGWLLITSWSLLILTAVLVLFYFILAQYEFEKRIKEINLENDPSAINEKRMDKLAEYTDAKLAGKRIAANWILNEEDSKRKVYDKLGLISSILFSFGIGTLGIFTYFNFFS